MEEYGHLSRGEFAARLRAARAYLGWRLEDAAPKIGVSRQALSRRESGAVHIRNSDRWVMATIYTEASGWPREFFTEEAWPEIPAPAEVEVEPEDVAHLVEEGQDDAAQA